MPPKAWARTAFRLFNTLPKDLTVTLFKPQAAAEPIVRSSLANL
jgi:hypothetical protein